jgi:hypothetical protein
MENIDFYLLYFYSLVCCCCFLSFWDLQRCFRVPLHSHWTAAFVVICQMTVSLVEIETPMSQQTKKVII